MVTPVIEVFDLIEPRLDAEPGDAISGAFEQNRHDLLCEAAAEHVGKRECRRRCHGNLPVYRVVR